MTEPALSLQKVCKSYGRGAPALSDIDLDIGEGEFVSLLGPSGCGKTTTLRVIAGFEAPSSGRVILAGQDITLLPANRRPVNTVFQDYALFPHMTVAGNVGFGLSVRGVASGEIRRRVGDALDLVGLGAFAGAYPRERSGGMKMRVSIARAMVTHPKLILMDEPFAALDEITRFKLNKDLLDLKEKIGCTVVFVTHSVFESVFLSDRIVVMAARPGRVVEELVVDEPYPRTEAFRTSAAYAAQCRAASDALHRAMGDAA